MKGFAKSHAQAKILSLVNETIADGYASLRSLAPHLVRHRDERADIEYVSKRCAEEGLTFLTETMPRLGDWFDGFVWKQEQERVVGFKPYNGLYPCFLRPFWIYFQKPLTELTAADAECIRILRTLLHGLKKLDIPTSRDKIDKKLDSFLTIEEELSDFEVCPTKSLSRAQILLDDFCSGYRPTCDRPRHGPGAVAGRERHNEKWNFSTIHESVHREWPYWDFLFPVRTALKSPHFSSRSYPLQLAASARAYRQMTRVDAPTARLLLVPKDSRGPRVISCEPAELMYLQQGVADHFTNYIVRHPYTKGHVNFDDQTVNADLALSASADQAWDTIDMSDASDRVSCNLVSYLFPQGVSRKWLALRSTATILPDGRRVPLAKFAPMGSALCFPVESLVFWAIAVASVWEQTNDLPLALASVYVYGDDIIIARGYTNRVICDLESVALKVNRSKSFIGTHPFRESCGVEALCGFDITPFRVKKVPPLRSTDGSSISAWVQYAENTRSIAPRRSAYCIRQVEELLGPIPRVPFAQPFLSIVDPENAWKRENFRDVRWSAKQSYYRSKLYSVRMKRTESPIDGWRRLQRNLILGCVDCTPSLVVDRQSTLIRKQVNNITYLSWEPLT